MYKYKDIKAVHLEMTEKCNLACLMCDRNINGGEVNPYLEGRTLTYRDIRLAFSPSFLRQLKKIYMCGNYGDPILAPHVLEIMDYFKFHNKNINFNKHTWEGWSNLSRKNISVTESPNVIINTSCEHTKDDWFKKIPKGLMVVLQSNDYLQGDGHINCCGDLRDFDASYTLTDTFYLGQKELEKYTRFMKIGIK